MRRWYPRFITTLHAELSAGINARRSIVGSTMIVVRVLKNGSLVCSKPCARCMSFLIASGIKALYYTDENNEMQRVRL
jgi:deoxycytidylate deaminase